MLDQQCEVEIGENLAANMQAESAKNVGRCNLYKFGN